MVGLMRFWKTWQYSAYGCIAAIISDEDKALVEVPTSVASRKLLICGSIIASTVVLMVLFEFSIRTLWAKRKGWRKKIDEDTHCIVLDLLDKYKPSIEDWMDENGFIEHTPSFYEEYLFYKYYYKMGKWFIKKKITGYFPSEVERLAEQSKKNYLTARLAGLSE
jgi:hypothetical protein